MRDKTLILGIGNTLLGDDGVGVHVLDALRHQHPRPDGVELLDEEMLSYGLVPAIGDAAHLIVIDAARLDSSPGTIRIYEGQSMDRFLVGHKNATGHEVSLRDLLAAVRRAGRVPRQRALIGIQPELVGWSEKLTGCVEGAIPRASDLARDLVMRWRQRSASPGA